MTWPLVALVTWFSALAVGIWVLRWRMAKDVREASLLRRIEELQTQLAAANQAQAIAPQLSRMRFK